MYAWLAAGQPTNDSAVPETTVVPQSGSEHDLMVESSTNEAQPAALAPLPAVAATAAAGAAAKKKKKSIPYRWISAARWTKP